MRIVVLSTAAAACLYGVVTLFGVFPAATTATASPRAPERVIRLPSPMPTRHAITRPRPQPQPHPLRRRVTTSSMRRHARIVFHAASAPRHVQKPAPRAQPAAPPVTTAPSALSPTVVSVTETTPEATPPPALPGISLPQLPPVPQVPLPKLPG